MPTLLTAIPETPPQPLRTKRWTREDCEPLAAAGIFERDRLELIDGELISKMPKNRPHVNAETLTLYWLVETFGKFLVNHDAPIDVSPEDNPVNEPEPDLIVFRRDFRTFPRNPQPEDIALVVEVSDSTLRSDLNVKARLYARAGIPEYWVLDVPGRRLLVHREPSAGNYVLTEYSEFETVSPLAAPNAEFRAADVLAR